MTWMTGGSEGGVGDWGWLDGRRQRGTARGVRGWPGQRPVAHSASLAPQPQSAAAGRAVSEIWVGTGPSGPNAGPGRGQGQGWRGIWRQRGSAMAPPVGPRQPNPIPWPTGRHRHCASPSAAGGRPVALPTAGCLWAATPPPVPPPVMPSHVAQLVQAKRLELARDLKWANRKLDLAADLERLDVDGSPDDRLVAELMLFDLFDRDATGTLSISELADGTAGAGELSKGLTYNELIEVLTAADADKASGGGEVGVRY